MQVREHGGDILQDLLRPGLRLVVCGTAASARSALVGAYYAGPGNKFWRTLHAIGLTRRLLSPEEWRVLDAHGIGFTDLAKRHSGMDKDLPPDSFDAERVRRAILTHQPFAVAFNGKTAARAFLGKPRVDYGVQPDRIGGTTVWILPSTSGAASGAWSLEPWHRMAQSLPLDRLASHNKSVNPSTVPQPDRRTAALSRVPGRDR